MRLSVHLKCDRAQLNPESYKQTVLCSSGTMATGTVASSALKHENAASETRGWPKESA